MFGNREGQIGKRKGRKEVERIGRLQSQQGTKVEVSKVA